MTDNRTYKRCRNCGVSLATKHHLARYCSAPCRVQYRANQWAKKPVAVTYKPQLPCKCCGFAFNPVNALHIYCSDVCRQSINTAVKRKAQGVKRPQRVLLQDVSSFPGKQAYKEHHNTARIARAARRRAKLSE